LNKTLDGEETEKTMQKYFSFLVLMMIAFIPGQMIFAQGSDVTLNREDFPPVRVAERSGDCLVTVESVGLPFAGYSTLNPYQRTIAEMGGTGLIVSSNGYIITAPDVVRDSEILTVTYKGEEYDATLEMIDDYYDLALIKIDAHGLPAVRWGDSNMVVRGDPVVVMGAPVGLEESLTYGFVTNIRDFRIVGPHGYDGMLVLGGFVIDAALHAGVQTGPVFNSNGEAIAIVSRKSRGGEEDIGYTVPSNLVRSVVDQMINEGSVCHPWLGIFPHSGYDRALALYMGIPIHEIDPEPGVKCDVVGVFVETVEKRSPAAESGIVRGDLLLRADEKLIRTVKDLETIILNKGCGETVSLEIIRNFEIRLVIITIGDKQEDYGNIYVAGRNVSI
jgi:serine protease Do